MKFLVAILACLGFLLPLPAQSVIEPPKSSRPVQLTKVFEIDAGQPLGQLQAVPLNLGPGKPKAVLAVYGQDSEVNPYEEMFFLPYGYA